MPTYVYECKTCLHVFEKVQNMSDEAIKICPKCNNEVRRLISGGAGIIFKGSGFYINDAKRTTESSLPSNSKASSADKSASDTGSAAASKSEAKPSSETKSVPTKETA